MKLLKNQFVIVFLFLILLLYILFRLIKWDSSSTHYSSSYSEQSDREIAQTINVMANKLTLVVRSAQSIPEDVANILEFQRIDKAEIDIIQESILLNNPEFFGTCIAYDPYKFNKNVLYYAPYVFREGDSLYYTNLDDPDYNYFYKDWYLIPMTLMKASWSEPYYDESVDVLMTTYSIPFYRFDGKREALTGVITIDVSVDWLTKGVQSLKISPDVGYFLLVSENGTIISSPFPEEIYNQTIFSLAAERNMPQIREIGRDIQRGRSGFKTVLDPVTKKNWQIAYSSIPANHWGLLYFYHTDRD